MHRLSLCSAALVVGLVVVLGSPLWSSAQPAEAPSTGPSPLELVRGLREQGMADLALEYLKELESKPLSAYDKSTIPLERAKCQLDAADDEPDEGSRAALVAEAKEGFAAFLKSNPNHPRVTEASLALARLTSLDAKAALARARRLEDPDQEKAEAAKARPIFQQASDLFEIAARNLDAQLKQPNLDGALRRALEQEKFEADLARGINQFAMGDTYVNPNAAEKKQRSELIDKARDIFGTIARVPNPGRTAWVALAWMAECDMEKDERKTAEEEFNKILTANTPTAEDGIRTVKFFQLRRRFLEALAANTLPDILAAEQMARRWLNQYGNVRRARAEATATRWYLGFNLHRQALAKLVWSKDKTPKLLSVPDDAKRLLAEAEKYYRIVTQSDNEYSHRAARRRMEAVRLLLGDADRPPTDYKTFEDCQMASLIQISKLMELEKDPQAKEADIKARRLSIVALLERARELVTEKDNPADVVDTLIRLIYFYETTGQPQQAAVLGEHVARTMKAPGGKGAVAGSLGVAGYTGATNQIKIDKAEELYAARRVDRDRAIRLARFLDEKYPNDTATDRARHRLASLLYEDGKLVEAYDALTRVRAGYDQVANARLFQGALASQLLTAKDSVLPEARRPEVFRRTIADLDKTVRPSPTADVDDVRAYLSGRCRLALLYLLQSRVLGEEADKASPGYGRAAAVAKDTLDAMPAFAKLYGPDKQLNLDGWEMKLQIEDARTRAAYLRGQTAYANQKYDDVFVAIGDLLAEMNKDGRFVDAVKGIVGEGNTDKKDKDPDAMDAGSGAKAKVSKMAESVDKLRRELLIVLALKARVKQGQVEKATELIDLLKKFGANLEANVDTLQQLSAEIAAQILAFRREGKVEDAKALTEGFGKLIDKISAEPNLPPSMQLFMGQALIVVGDYEKAAESLKKVPAPQKAEWLTTPMNKLQDEQRRQVNEYRRATLELIRAFRLGKKYAEADGLLNYSMGTQEKQGWAYTSLDFRKEVAYLYEARGSDDPNVKQANELWGKALQQWTSLYNMTRNRVERDLKEPPKDANGNVDNKTIGAHKNDFFESFFDVQRCLIRANTQLLKGNPKLQSTYDKVAKAFLDQEKINGTEMYPEVKLKYYELIEEFPELKKAYQAQGGKLFLEKPAGISGT